MKEKIVRMVLLFAAVSVWAYDPPTLGVLEALRWYTLPDTLQMYVSVDEDCGVDRSNAEGLIEAMMIRSRVRRADGPAVLAVEVTCIKPSPEEYVYRVDASLYVDAYVGDETILLQIPNFHGVVGITQSADSIEDAMVDGAERVITDLIYAHSN